MKSKEACDRLQKVMPELSQSLTAAGVHTLSTVSWTKTTFVVSSKGNPQVILGLQRRSKYDISISDIILIIVIV